MFYCIVCDSELTESSVEEHIMRIHPTVCAVCEETMPTETDMETHIETFHPGIRVG